MVQCFLAGKNHGCTKRATISIQENINRKLDGSGSGQNIGRPTKLVKVEIATYGAFARTVEFIMSYLCSQRQFIQYKNENLRNGAQREGLSRKATNGAH